MKKDKIRETLAFKELTAEEKEKRGILGRLYGPIADIVNPTRNGRRYSEELWEQVFENPIMKEKFNNKVMYGELGHPADREEIDMEKIAVCMPEPPKKDEEGHLIGYFDILNTPNGRILKTLCDYGSTLGISSRGTGDVITDEDGNEEVDPSTYDCECWDVVIIPAVESARLRFTEGLQKEKTLKMALTESLNSASEEDKRVMKETLDELNIKIDEECTSENCTDIKDEESNKENDEKDEANNDGSEELMNSLKEALKSKTELEATIKSLQEQLAVSNAKVSGLEEDNAQDKSTIVRLTSLLKKSKDAVKKVSELEESLNEKTNKIKELESVNNSKVTKLQESVSKIREDASTKTKELTTLQESYNNLKESYEKKLEDVKTQLTESKVKHSKEVNALTEKLNKQTKLVERYKSTTYSTVERYIKTKANMLGISVNEIKNKLDESYTLDDIDNVCDKLRDYSVRMNNLPFRLNNKSVVKVKESLANKNVNIDAMSEDDIDEGRLLQIAGVRDKE